MTTSKLFRNISTMLILACIYSLFTSSEPLAWKLIIGVNSISYGLLSFYFRDIERGGKWLEDLPLMNRIADWTIKVELKYKNRRGANEEYESKV